MYRIKRPAAGRKAPAVISAALPRAMDTGPAVVWKSIGMGEFVVRRRKNRPADECPFLACEVIRIAPGKNPVRKTAGKAHGHRLTREACRELLVMGLTGLIVCKETIRHKMKKERIS